MFHRGYSASVLQNNVTRNPFHLGSGVASLTVRLASVLAYSAVSLFRFYTRGIHPLRSLSFPLTVASLIGIALVTGLMPAQSNPPVSESAFQADAETRTPAAGAGAATDATRSVERGGIAVSIAKAFFILSGLIQQTYLSRFLGLDGYGAFARVSSIVGVVNNVVVTGSIQGVSRSIVMTPDDHVGNTLRRAIKTHVVIAIVVALAFFFFAPVFAAFQGAQHIVRPLRVVSIVVLFYGLYAPLVGALNGLRRFTMQAGLDILYAVLRTAGLLGLGWLFARGCDGAAGQGVLGACIGFACAATIIFPVALRVTGIGASGSEGPSVKQHLTFIVPVAFGQVFLQLLMQSDIWMLGHFASRLAASQHVSSVAAKVASDEIVGVYRACQLFAFLPFQMLITLTFIMFPMLAKAKAMQDDKAIAYYVRTGMRLAFVFASLMVAVVSSLAPQLLHLLFSDDVGVRGGNALRILALGHGAFAIFCIETTVLSSLGRERISALLTGAAALLVCGLSGAVGYVAVTDGELLLYTAFATAFALFAAASFGAAVVHRVAKAYVRPLTALRVFGTIAVVAAIGLRVSYAGRLWVVPQIVMMASLTLLLLVLSREVGKPDLITLRSAVLRKR